MRVAILGTGKMALDLAAHYLGCGVEVVAAARDGERLGRLFAALQRKHRRLAAGDGSANLPAPVAARIGVDPPPEVDLAIECTSEDLEAKRALCAAASELLCRARAVATNSSSFLPRDVFPGAVGAHHFFPAMLTRIVELVVDRETAPAAAEVARACAAAADLAVVEEDEASAFAANRLLLPVQSEAIRLLRRGAPAPLVDRASAGPLLPTGALAAIDDIGIDTIGAAVVVYRARMTDAEASDLAELARGLAELAAAGKRGKKNGDGLLLGAALPWPPGAAPFNEAALRPRFAAVALNSCARILDASALGGGELNLVLTRAFGAEARLGEALAAAREDGTADLLAEAHAAEGLGYLLPSPRLRG